MLNTLAAVAVLWLVAAFLYVLLRSRLRAQHRRGWVYSASAMSFLIFAFGQIAPRIEHPAWIFLAVTCVAALATGYIYPYLRDQIANIAILLILTCAALAYSLTQIDVWSATHYILASISGVLIHLAVRGPLKRVSRGT